MKEVSEIENSDRTSVFVIHGIEEFINSTTIEGLYTLKSIHKLIKNKKVDIPIIDLVYDIVFNNENPEELKRFLITKK